MMLPAEKGLEAEKSAEKTTSPCPLPLFTRMVTSSNQAISVLP